jgi:beta-hydroxylase
MNNGDRERALTLAEKARDLAVDGGQQIMSGLEWWLLRSSEIPTTPFLDRGGFPWADTLEKHWHDVRAELDAVLDRREDLPNFQDILRDIAPISRDDQWKTFFFTAYGYRSEPNRARCPATTALTDQIPGLVTAFFSILSPGKHIPPHRGPFRGVVRCHLALKIPTRRIPAGSR